MENSRKQCMLGLFLISFIQNIQETGVGQGQERMPPSVSKAGTGRDFLELGKWIEQSPWILLIRPNTENRI